VKALDWHSDLQNNINQGNVKSMSLAISDVRPAIDSEWDSIWKSCDYATYFHSREWAAIWNKYTNGDMDSAAMLITFSDGAVALLPFSYRKIVNGFIKQYISSPAGTFGGWISLDGLSFDHGNLLYEYIIANHRDLIWRLNPYDPVVMSIKTNGSRRDETQALQLDRGFNALYKSWTKGHASAARKARKAQKAGVKIREAVSIQDWKDYYNVYQDSHKRWGAKASSFYGWLLFQCMYESASSNIRLWLATYQNHVISGALCFYAKKHVVYWHGASVANYFNLRPVNLLMYEIIKHTCENGYQWFDFNPSGGHKGVENFKSSFGARKFACPVVDKKSLVFGIVSKVHALMRSA
jgi:hypothetical protein